MTAPKTRAELIEWLADKLRIGEGRPAYNTARSILAALDTFAVVCPKEPTEKMVETAAEWAMVRNHLLKGIAASPFAPKDPTDG